MKKFSSVVGGLCFAFGLLIIASGCDYEETHYTVKGKITDNTNGIITVTDTRGEMWDFEQDDFKVGDNVKVTFDNNHTSTLYDDMIEKIKKIK